MRFSWVAHIARRGGRRSALPPTQWAVSAIHRGRKLFPSEVEPPPDDETVARVRMDQVRLERSRRFGDCFLGLELWKRLELDCFWGTLLDRPDAPADVRWSRMAALMAVNRLCAPGSELASEERWYPSTARQAKEKAIHSRFSARMEKALATLAQRVAQGQLKDRNKIERRVGKIQARHPQVADLYEVQVAEKSGEISLEWQVFPGRRKTAERRGAPHSEICRPAVSSGRIVSDGASRAPDADP